MGINIINQYSDEKYGIVKIILDDPLYEDDSTKLIIILDKLLSIKKPFIIIVDLEKLKKLPVNAMTCLKNWMINSKELIKQYLICSVIIIKDNIVNNVVKKMIETLFLFTKPTRPNKISSNQEKCDVWMNEQLNLYIKERSL